MTADGEENLRQRAALQDKLDHQTVGVYDERDNSIVQAPLADAEKYKDLGLVVGDAEAAKKQVLNSPLAKADAFIHHAANAATFNSYDNIAALLGKKKYLQNEAAVTEENPYSSLAGDLGGGIVTAPYRGFNPVGVGLSAYEGGTAAATNDYALDEPITAERVIKGAGMAIAYNALFNLSLSAVAKGASGAGKGLHALNNKLGLFLKEGEEAGEELGKATYKPTKARTAKPEAPDTTPEPQTAAEKMSQSIGRDPEAIKKEFYENQAEMNRKLVELDGLDHESTAADKIRKALAKHEELNQKLSDEMGFVQSPTQHIGNPEALTGEGTFEYPGATKDSQRLNMWRKSFRELLGPEENHVAEAARQESGRLGNVAKREGRLDDASRHFENKSTIERELSRRLPDTFHPETGDLQPGFAKHIKEYSRLMGNDTADLGSLRYRAATPAEKAAIDAEVAAHPDSAAQFRGDQPSQSPTFGDGEPHTPNPEAPLGPDPGDIPEAPGEVNKISDINGQTPAEQSGSSVGKGGPKYQPRWKRSRFWYLNLATFGMAKSLIGTAAAVNELGPFILNNSTRFADGVQSLADRSAQGTAGALRKALSGTAGRNVAIGNTDPKKEFDRNVKTITAGQATPESLQQGVTQLLGSEAQEHPDLTKHVVAGIGRQLNVLSNNMPRNVQTPTARGSAYTPPRSAMIRFNRMVRAVNDPDEAIRHPDPDTWAAVQQAHPETAKYVQDTLMAVVANPKIKLNKQQARNVSVLLGQAITPQNQPEYLKSLQDAATLMNAPNPPGKSGGSGNPNSGPKSAKTGQQILSLEATPDQQAQLGL